MKRWGWFGTLLLLSGCSLSRPEAGSESHFLMRCEADANCGGGLVCAEGICTLRCDAADVCGELVSGARCIGAGSDAPGYCDVPCDADVVCQQLEFEASCAVEVCRPSLLSGDDATGGEVGGGAGGGGGPGDGDATPPAEGPGPGAGTAQPPTEAPLAAFVTGYDANAQVYLRGEQGEVLALTDWPVAPRQAVCEPQRLGGGGVAGGSGRFGNVAFGDSGRFVFFRETLACYFDPSSLLIRYDLQTGEARSLGRFPAPVETLSAGGVVLAYGVRDGSKVVALRVVEGDTLVPVTVPSVPEGQGLSLMQRVQLVALPDGVVVLIDQGPALRKQAQGNGWEVAEDFAPLQGYEFVSPLRVSPSGDLACAVGFRAGSGVGLLREADGQWQPFALSPGMARWGSSACAFAADESLVMFGSRLVQLDADGAVDAADVKQVEGFDVRGVHDGRFYGLRGQEVVRLDADTLVEDTLVGTEELAPLCPGTDEENQSTVLLTPPDGRPIAIVKRHCGCIDCDISGTLSLRLDTGETAVIDADQGRAFHEVSWPASGGAIQIGTRRGPNANYQRLSPQGELSLEVLVERDVSVTDVAVPPL